MDYIEILKAQHQQIEAIQASIELLEVRVKFFENYLKESNFELWAQYQRFVYSETQRLLKDARTALGNLPDFPEPVE
ncbi:hypothetical protein D0T49_00230 [Paludibacter sp. 221]|nr:hypothetical protein [Paludibacter sp. 221]